MKYMTFPSSCSYAALANLLSYHGIDTEDRAIALQIRLPYLFDKEGGQYLSGPMLQGAKWFRLYLSPLGFALKEHQLNREEAIPFLRENLPAMLGLHVTPDRKHAVICTSFQREEIIFLNNKHQQSSEPDTIRLTESDLFSRLDETVTIGVLKRTEPEYISL